MLKNLPFEKEKTTNGYRYSLAHRDIGSLRHLGWALIGIGCLVMGFMILWMWSPAVGGFQLLQNGQVMGWLMVAFAATGIAGFSFGAMVLAAGITVLRNRLKCEVEIRGETLYSTELLGWFRWKRKTKIDAIKKLRFADLLETESEEVVMPFSLNESAAIFAELSNSSSPGKGNGFVIAPGYAPEILEPLGEELALQLNKELGIKALAAGANDKLGFESIILDKASSDTEDPKLLCQPEDSYIEVLELDGATAYQVPAKGFRGSAVVILTLVGTGWTALSLVIAYAALTEAWQAKLNWVQSLQEVLIPVLSMLIGFVLLLIARNLAIRSAMIGLQAGHLFVERKSIFGTRWTEFEVEQIERIVCGPSGMEVNEEPVYELQVFQRGDKKTGLLSRLTRAELTWLAQELNRRLDLTPISISLLANALDSETWPHPPIGSQIEQVVAGTESEQQSLLARPASKFSIKILVVINVVLWVGFVVLFFTRPDFEGFLIVLPLGALVGLLIAWANWKIFGQGHEFRFTTDQLVIARDKDSVEIIGEFQRTEPLKLQIVDSGWEINGKKMKQLLLRSGSKKVITLFGRNEKDLAFVMAHIHAWHQVAIERHPTDA